MSADDLNVEEQAANVEANKAAETAPPPSPLDAEDVQIAAGHYASMVKMIKGYSSMMNGKGLARVMVALAEFPYGESYPKFKHGSEEQKLFTFMLSAQSAKAKIAEALQADLGSIQNQAVNGLVEQIQTETKET